MTDVYVIGSYSTAFRRWPELSVKDLTRDAYAGVLADAGGIDPAAIDFAWFGNCGMWVDGQGSIRGQVCMTPLIREGAFPTHTPIVNVEGGCATASMAFHGAWKDIASGQSKLSLALGVEKTFHPADPGKTERLFYGGIDQYDPQEWQDYYSRARRRASRSSLAPIAPSSWTPMRCRPRGTCVATEPRSARSPRLPRRITASRSTIRKRNTVLR